MDLDPIRSLVQLGISGKFIAMTLKANRPIDVDGPVHASRRQLNTFVASGTGKIGERSV